METQARGPGRKDRGLRKGESGLVVGVLARRGEAGGSSGRRRQQHWYWAAGQGESKDGAVRGIFNTEQPVLTAVTCTKEKERSGGRPHLPGERTFKKAENESKLKYRS